MRVVIHGDICQGHQACAIVAPDVFGSDEIGNGVVLITGDLPAELHALARRAQRNCPELAITISD
jgi:ferredoxin